MRLVWRRGRPPDVSAVMPRLLVGAAPDAAQCAELHRRGVRVVVDLRAEVPNEGHWPADVTVRKLPIADHRAPGAGELAELAGWIVDTLGHDRVVLVHCHAGQGRAPTVGCAVLIELGYGLDEAYSAMRAARPVMAPTDEQIAVLRHLARPRRCAA